MERSSDGSRDDAAVKIEEAEELLTLDEAVQLLGTSRPTIYRWLAQGEIRGLKVGKQWRFRRYDLIAYMERDPLAIAAAPEPLILQELAFFNGEIARLKASESLSSGQVEDEPGMERLVHSIFKFAVASRASDIHLEPLRNGDRAEYLLRLRIDGRLNDIRHFPMSLQEAMNLHFKQQANMDLTERRMPQEGRVPFNYQDKDYVLGVASIPTVYGEAITVRILLKDQMLMKLERIGISADHPLRAWLQLPSGVVLVAGPTGCGKTTTLYSCLNEIANPDRKTVVVSDNIDVVIPNTTTIQINDRAGMSYAVALRAVWSHDPDVLYIGDMPDAETARAIPEFALTGHLVLAQRNSLSAAEAVQDLVSTGVDRFAVAMSMAGVLAQRLARKICPNCKEALDMDPADPLLAIARRRSADGGFEIPENAIFYKGRGCDECRGTGYRGRVPLYEAMGWSANLRAALLRSVSARELEAIAVSEGMKTAFADGMEKAAAGITTLEEVSRATG